MIRALTFVALTLAANGAQNGPLAVYPSTSHNTELELDLALEPWQDRCLRMVTPTIETRTYQEAEYLLRPGDCSPIRTCTTQREIRACGHGFPNLESPWSTRSCKPWEIVCLLPEDMGDNPAR